jgi:hypothetical protein
MRRYQPLKGEGLWLRASKRHQPLIGVRDVDRVFTNDEEVYQVKDEKSADSQSLRSCFDQCRQSNLVSVRH